MAYATSGLTLISQGLTGPRLWRYESADARTVVDAAGYISDADDRGVQVGDLIFVYDNDASPVVISSHVVVSITAGAADLDDGVLLTGADSD